MATAYILDAVRTPRGRGKAGKGALSRHPPAGAPGADAEPRSPTRSGLDQQDVEDVVVGCVSQVERAGRQHRAQRGARGRLARRGHRRHAEPLLRLGRCRPCNFAAMGVMLGRAWISSSAAASRACRACRWAPTAAAIDGNNLHLRKSVFQVPQGISADLIATLEGFTREELDGFALELAAQGRARHRGGALRARALVAGGRSDDGHGRSSSRTSTRGRTPRRGARQRSSRRSSRMGACRRRAERRDARPARAQASIRRPRRSTTCTPPATRAASSTARRAVVLASERYVRKAHGLKPRARIRAMATAGAEPVIMLTAPAPASSAKALRQAGMKASDIDLWEINEAFAAVALQTRATLDIDPARVNVNGGAIALGHPLGATGAMPARHRARRARAHRQGDRADHAVHRRRQGIATIIERV